MNITVQAFLLCDSVNGGSNRAATMLAVFDKLLAGRLPTVRKCSVFCRLYVDEVRKYSIALQMETPSASTLQLMAPRTFAAKPNGILQVTFNIERLELTHEGIYTLKLLVDGRQASEYHVTVQYKNSAGTTQIADRNYGFTVARPSAKPD
jgi:hypothetical protein